SERLLPPRAVRTPSRTARSVSRKPRDHRPGAFAFAPHRPACIISPDTAASPHRGPRPAMQTPLFVAPATNFQMPQPPSGANELVLNEFLDKYGVRLVQLATVMSQVGPLAEAAPAPEST